MFDVDGLRASLSFDADGRGGSGGDATGSNVDGEDVVELGGLAGGMVDETSVAEAVRPLNGFPHDALVSLLEGGGLGGLLLNGGGGRGTTRLCGETGGGDGFARRNGFDVGLASEREGADRASGIV